MDASWSEAALRVTLPVAAAVVGGLVGAVGSGERRPMTGLVIHCAAGTFLALVILHLLPESGEQAGWAPALVAAAAGWGLCVLMTRKTGAACPACTEGHAPAERATFGASLLAVVAIHSALDGLALAGAGETAHGADLLSMAVLVHKIPEGMAVAAVCRAGGRGVAAAVGITAAVESATLVGYLAAVRVLGAHGLLLGLGLGGVAGSLLYLVWVTFRDQRRADHPLRNLGLAILGALVVVVSRFIEAGH